MSDKKTAIISTALSLFISKGIHAVGINEVIAKAGVAKKTLYHHFDSKEAVVLAALAYRDQLFMNWLDQHMAHSDPKQAILGMFDALDEWFNNREDTLGNFRGCFFINASVEFKEITHPINQRCAAHKVKVFERVLEETLKIRADQVSAIQMAKTLCLLKEGAITTALVQANPQAAKDIIPLVTLVLRKA